MSRRYLVISPCRDEEEFAEHTIASMISQTERPTKWIIVDDGSSDCTPEIIGKAAAEHDWITVITRPPRKTRVLGSGVVHTFNAGLETENIDTYDFVSKLDVDLILPPTYYDELIGQMERDPRLGTASGRPYIASDGNVEGDSWEAERGAPEMSAGMAKLYRVTTFKEIGGLVPEIMWDGIDCHEARIRGWKSRSFDDPRSDFRHLRPEGGSDSGVLRGRRRHGYGQWFMGTDPLFMLASVMLRAKDAPAFIGSLNMLAGYSGAAMRHATQYGDKQFRAELRHFQRESLLLGKIRATTRWEDKAASRWSGNSDQRAVAYLVSHYPEARGHSCSLQRHRRLCQIRRNTPVP
jgi:biofilm PGA synthesis N-glycosyltransferase PgaC